MNILPKIDVPTYSTTIPSTGKKIAYRPYLVKEEKVLLIALESNDNNQISGAINNIVLECTDNKVSLDDLTVFDLEFLFIKIRSKSVGETTDLEFICGAEGCDQTTRIKVDFNDIRVEGLEKEKLRHDLGNGLIIDMKYPDAKSKDLLNDVDDNDILVTSVAGLIKTIYYNDEIFNAKEVSLEEKIEFLGNLNTAQFAPLLNSVITMPHIQYDVKWKCKCGEENELRYTSLADFFT